MVKDSGYFKNGYQKDDLNGGRIKMIGHPSVLLPRSYSFWSETAIRNVPKQQCIAVDVASAANMTRTGREAQLYAEFRDIIGAKIGESALPIQQVRDLVHEAQSMPWQGFLILCFDLSLDYKRL